MQTRMINEYKEKIKMKIYHFGGKDWVVDYKRMVNIDNRHRRLQAALRDVSSLLCGKVSRFPSKLAETDYRGLPEKSVEQIKFYRESTRLMENTLDVLTKWEFLNLI